MNSACSTYNNSCRNYTISALQKPAQFTYKEDFDEFTSVYPVIEKDLMTLYFKDIPSATTEYFSKVLRYNLTNGKLFRGLAVVSTFKLLKGLDNITQEDIKVACVLGWCTEMLEATAIVMDDIMDQSERRRGIPCWYKLPEVGLQAVNDSLIIENALYALLKKYISNHAFYTTIVELFHETMFRMLIGEMLDLQSASDGKLYLETFNTDTYNLMVFNKTTSYTFVLPILLPLYLAKKHNSVLYSQLLPIFEKMGLLFQVKDDSLDCFGNYQKMGKEGSDIRTGKRSWLAIKALEYFTPNQREIFEQHYGKNALDSEEIIRNLYKQLGLQDTETEYEAELFKSICSDIKKIPSELFPSEILLKYMEKYMKTFSSHSN